VTSFFGIIGALTLLSIANGLAAIGIGYAVERFEDRSNRRNRECRAQAIREFGDRLEQDAWWFSEDVPTMNLIAVIARHLSRSGGFPLDDVHAKWRKDREAHKPIPVPETTEVTS